MDATPDRRVLVVGVDGSAGADAALRWAMEEAVLRGGVVRAVMAVRTPDLLAYEPHVLPDPEQGWAAAAAGLRRRVQELREQFGLAAEVEAIAKIGSPVSVLLDAAWDAELLVVGHRGRGPWRSALLGSVGLAVVLRAPCPVTVVPAPAPAAGTPHEAAATELSTPLPVGPIA